MTYSDSSGPHRCWLGRWKRISGIRLSQRQNKQMSPRCFRLHLRSAQVQMASWSLVRFLWCMLWCRTSSSLRANFFWQFGHRQLNGFSPERGGMDGQRVDRKRHEEGWCSNEEEWGGELGQEGFEMKEILECCSDRTLYWKINWTFYRLLYVCNCSTS